ncbi:MAG: arylsulfatase [Vicinamibacterales bacterium]|nr:arylsulfatase [Vicinamibacterales bacterium]|tara:strand:- start:184 stop:1623 length:1440 start_codon:yes stop_codon:yes gene_type:complete
MISTNIRCGLRAVVAAIALLASACVAPEPSEAPTEGVAIPPNVIYILADDLGYGDLGAYGQELIATPNLDRLAAVGLVFTQHYAGSTVCAPSRAVLMAGLHTGHTVIRGNREVQPEGQHPIPDSRVTLAERLKALGYQTAAIGKWGLGAPETEGVPTRQGFDYFFGYNDQREAHSYYPDHLWRNEAWVDLNDNREGARGTYSHDLLVEDTLRYVREAGDEPFFLYLPFTIPHAGLDVPEDSMAPYLGRFDETLWEGQRRYITQATPRAAFAGMVSRLDRDVGRIVDQIDELGLAERTLVIFTSDNGPHQEAGADPVFFGSGGGLRGIKRDLYEGGIRVPMIARWPGTVAAGTTTDHVSAFWDVTPTMLELAGAPPAGGLDGVSFAPTLLNEPQQRHEYLYWEFHERGGKQAVRMGDWKAVRLNVEEDPAGPVELYDLSTDPTEARDVAGEHPDVVARMVDVMREAHAPSDLFPFPGDQP